jgi:PKD domain-containing protein
MGYRKTVVLLTVLLMVFSLNTFAKQKTIKRVNVAPLIKVKGGISSADQLKSLVEEHAEKIKAGFEKAGAANLFPAFMNQIKSAEITEKDLPKGQEMMWMLFYSAKKAKAINDLKWDANKSLPVYALSVQTDCKDYHFIIPKACGNVSLVNFTNSMAICDMKVSPAKANKGDTITVDMSGSKCSSTFQVSVYHEGQHLQTEKLSADNPVWKTKFSEPGKYEITGKAFNADGIECKNECKGKVYINFPPECDLKVSPSSSYTGKPFKLDASGSTDKDGKVVKADFTISDTKDGQEVDKNSVTTDPLVWDKIFKKSGIYKVSLIVTDDFNATSTNKCVTTLEVQKRLYYLIEAGPGVAKGTYSGYAFARFGLAYLIIPEKLSFIASAGANFTLAGNPFKHHFISNLLLNVHFDSFFLGGGIGFTSKVRDPDWKGGLDLVGNIGFDVYSSFNKKGSIFGEIRVPMQKDLSFEHGHQFLIGFRYLF